MFKSLKKSTPDGGDSVSTTDFLDSLHRGECHSAPHNIPPRVTGGSFCNYDGATAWRAKVHQFRGAKLFQEVCNYYRPWYDIDRTRIRIEPSWGFGEDVTYRKAAQRELRYLKMEDRPPIGDVFEYPDFHLVFSCHFGDGLLDFRKGISDVVVIYGWRMFERVRTLQAAYEIVHEQLYRMGFKIVEYSIRRVDFNITTIDFPIQLFGDAFRNSTFKSLARNTQVHEGRPGEIQTLYIGKTGGSVQFRAYDKTAELKSLANKYEAREKANALFQRFGLSTVSQITRIEFELGATFLSDFEISTFSELETRLESIIIYLFRNWLRFLEDNRETYRHKSREKVAAWWLECERMMLAWADSIGEIQEEQERKPHPVGNGSRAHALAKAFVMIAAAELKRTEARFDVKEFANELAALIERSEIPRWGGALSKRDFMLNYEAQQAKLAKEEIELRRAEIRAESPQIQYELEQQRRFLRPWEFKDDQKSNESENIGEIENAKTEDK